MTTPGTSVTRWVRHVAGLLSAALLLPMPVSAAVLYFSGAWTANWTGTSPDPFTTASGNTSGTFFGTPTLNFALNSTSYSGLNGTMTLTSPNRGALSIGTSNPTGTWSTLGNIYNIKSGASSIQVQISFGSNNMFSGNYSSMPNPISGTLGNGTYQITVAFKFTGASFSANSTPYTLTFN